jgi:hypothetical protein
LGEPVRVTPLNRLEFENAIRLLLFRRMLPEAEAAATLSAFAGDVETGRIYYEDFAELDRAELRLIEPLRTLRLIHYSAWLARRWNDPAFPAAFPWFGNERYWQDRILELREQVAAMQEPALEV